MAKKDKEDTYQELRNKAVKDKNNAKSHTSTSANQSQTQAPKKDKCGCQKSHLATGVNATEVAKKDKDIAKDLNHVECYICKQKGYYGNKCPEKAKN